ncbi:MAG: hypothetical protein NTY71_05300 [Methanoregula sp.]|jgi:hypothetical protein|nr:hypothetical protein [Methanoregula sp.]
MEKMELNMKDVAEPDLFASGTAVTGQENNAWRELTTGFFYAGSGEPGLASWLTARLVRKLRRQIMRLEGRRNTPNTKRPAIRTVVW